MVNNHNHCFFIYRWRGNIVWGVCSEDVNISSIPKSVLPEQKKVGISKTVQISNQQFLNFYNGWMDNKN